MILFLLHHCKTEILYDKSSNLPKDYLLLYSITFLENFQTYFYHFSTFLDICAEFLFILHLSVQYAQ